MGIKGFIRDGHNAHRNFRMHVVQVQGILHPIRSVNSGAYWRLLLPGLHNITVTASGYIPQTIYNVKITNENITSVSETI